METSPIPDRTNENQYEIEIEHPIIAKAIPIRTRQDREWEAEKIRRDFVKSTKICVSVPPKKICVD